MLLYWVWLSQLKLSLRQKHRLLRIFGDPEAIYQSTGRHLYNTEGVSSAVARVLDNKDMTEANSILKECKEKGIGVIGMDDLAYPPRLRNIFDAPLVLYVRGVIPDWNRQPVLGVVGTRRASSYGLTMASRIGEHIARCGALVISGGAAGVDTQAMKSALQTGKPVVGVLGCGIDVIYPSSNKELFQKVEQQGCLISEYPPQMRATKWSFLARNRIISGISNGLVVVEAPEQSGSLNTARNALEQGRDLFVVPGMVDAETFFGSHLLLRDGATPVFNGWDVMKDYAPLWPETVTWQPEPEIRKAAPELILKQPKQKPITAAADKKAVDKEAISPYSVVDTADLTDTEKKLLSLLNRENVHMDLLVAQMDMSASSLKGVLTKLSIKGLVQMLPGGRVKLK